MTNQEFDSCMQRMAAGDRLALQEIYEEYLPYIFSIITGFVKSKEDRQDLSADFFVKLYTGAAAYRPGRAHRGYLAAMARNLAVDHLRKTGKEVLFPQNEREEDGNPEEEILTRDQTCSSPEEMVVGRMSFQEAVESLPEAARTIVSMKILGDMTFREIAQTLQMPMGTVTWKYQDSMKRLRRAMG